MEISWVLFGLFERAWSAQVLGSPADQCNLWRESSVTASVMPAPLLEEHGCSPVPCVARSSWTQHLQSHLYHQTHEDGQWKAHGGKRFSQSEWMLINNIPVHAIWSLNGVWPPVQMKLSVTGILGLFVVTPSAFKACLMHSSLCEVEKRNMTSFYLETQCNET